MTKHPVLVAITTFVLVIAGGLLAANQAGWQFPQLGAFTGQQPPSVNQPQGSATLPMDPIGLAQPQCIVVRRGQAVILDSRIEQGTVSRKLVNGVWMISPPTDKPIMDAGQNLVGPSQKTAVMDGHVQWGNERNVPFTSLARVRQGDTVELDGRLAYTVESADLPDRVPTEFPDEDRLLVLVSCYAQADGNVTQNVVVKARLISAQAGPVQCS